MTISKLKLGAVLAVAAVGFTWAALAADPKPITPPAVKAEPSPKADAKPADKPKADAVATINGEDISRAEFGEYLIRKYGAKEIELFVNQRIIQDAAAEKDIRIPADELVAAFEADAKGVGVSRADFVKLVLPKYGKTEQEWWVEVLTPRLMLAKMLTDTKATEDDLKKLFERKYGEQRRVQLIRWEKELDRKVIQAEHALAKANPKGFNKIAREQHNVSLAAAGGHVAPIGRRPASDGDDTLHDTVFAMQAGEVSELLDLKGAYWAVKLVEVIPPRTDKKFEDEKEALQVEATKEKVEAAIPKLFDELKAKAKPVYHIQPEPKTQPTPKK